MRTGYRIVAILFLSAPWMSMVSQTVTLHPPQDEVTHKYSEDKACFSFKYGQLKEVTRRDWDFCYGFLSLGEQDWFILHRFPGSRSVIKDLGKHKWEDSFTVPVLKPLPELSPRLHQRLKQSDSDIVLEGPPRNFVIDIDSSAGTHKKWAKTTAMFAKVASGHIYLVHVKDNKSDFYALFRVENFEQHKYCTISWRLAPAPKAAEQPQD